MSYNNAIFKVRGTDYVYDSSINAENFSQYQNELYYLSGKNYISAAGTSYDSNTLYYRQTDWIQIPAIKGTSVWAAANSTSKQVEQVVVNGQHITIYNEDPNKTDIVFDLWDGRDGIGTVNSVDGTEPDENSTNVNLNAVRYVQQTIDSAQKSQARNNIDAATIMVESLTVNNKGIDNLATNPSITLTPGDIGAVSTTLFASLTINNKEINNPSTTPSITLTPGDIGAATVAAIDNLGNLKVNNKGITNIATSPSITLVPSDIGLDMALNSSSTNPVANSALYNKFNSITPKIAAITVASSAWDSGVSDVYTASVALPTGISLTSNTKADMYPNAEVMTQMANDGIIGLYLVNDNQQLKMKAVGEKPTANLTNIQVSFVETIT